MLRKKYIVILILFFHWLKQKVCRLQSVRHWLNSLNGSDLFNLCFFLSLSISPSLHLSCLCYTIRHNSLFFLVSFILFFVSDMKQLFIYLLSPQHHLSLNIFVLSSLQSLSLALLFPSSRPTSHLLLSNSSLLHFFSSFPTSSHHGSRTIASSPSLPLPSSDLSPPLFCDEVTSPPLLCENYTPLLCDGSATWRLLCLSPPWSLCPVMSLFLWAPPLLHSSSPPNLLSSTTSRRWLLLCDNPTSHPRWRQLCFSSKVPWRLVGEQPIRFRCELYNFRFRFSFFLIKLFCNYFHL